MSVIVAAAAAIALFTQDVQMPGAAMAERIAARVASAAPTACDRALAEAEALNAEGLFTGASVCGASEREDDMIFLLLAGQARASADMALAMPETLPVADENGLIDLSEVPEPPFEVIDLYGFIYGYAGGAGSTEFYRDEARTEELFARLDAWEPTRPQGYSPGWQGSRVADATEYADSISALVASRREQLLRLAQLYRNDDYYELQQELEALRAENQNRFVVGTPAHQRHQELQAAQAELAARLSAED